MVDAREEKGQQPRRSEEVSVSRASRKSGEGSPRGRRLREWLGFGDSGHCEPEPAEQVSSERKSQMQRALVSAEPRPRSRCSLKKLEGKRR